MNERRARPVRATGVTEGVAAAVRRRQREREPRVVLYGRSGSARVLAPAAPGHDDLLEIAERMVEAAGTAGARSDRDPRRGPTA